MHEQLHLLDEVKPLRDPVFICGFTGWTDSHGAANGVVQYLAEQWNAKPLAEIVPEPYYDFTVQRPRSRNEGMTRVLDWPSNRFSVASPEGADRDVLLFSGIEPHLRWRSFIDAIVEMLEYTRSTTSVTLGVQPGAVPHTRTAPVTLSASDDEFETQFGLRIPVSRYEGPTGLMSVLNLRLRAMDWRNASLWAIVPHYLNVGPNPNAMASLVRMLDRGYGTHTSLAGIDTMITDFNQKLDSALEPSGEAAAYVRTLEEQYDAQHANDGSTEPVDLGRTEDILGDLEQFLREHRDEGPKA
ncbi:MAG: PAC2 family protein [Chloroflexota bacterium]